VSLLLYKYAVGDSMNLVTNEPLKRSPRIRETHNQDAAVLLDPHRGKLYPLNPVAALISKRAGEGLTPLQIGQNVATTCNDPLELANADGLGVCGLGCCRAAREITQARRGHAL